MSRRGKSADAIAAEAALVGRAFRCADGLVRWITHHSARRYYTLLWLDEPSNTWHSGGIVKAAKWEGGEEVAPPRPGERYRLAGAMGTVDERIAQTNAARP